MDQFKLKTLLTGMLLGAVFAALGLRSCRNQKAEVQPQVKYVVDTSWYSAASNPMVVDTIFKHVPANIDTAAIIRNHFAVTFQVDSISDGNVMAVIRDSISENKLIDRNFSYQIVRPQTIITNGINQSRQTSAFLGSQFGQNTWGPTLFVSHRKVGLGVLYNFQNQSFSVNLAYKIL